MTNDKRSPATYKDVQRLTGLSLATISKYYNGRNVLAANRAAIEAAAEELGYRVNTSARNLRRGVTRTIGVLLPSLQNSFHLSVVVEVEKYFRSQGIGVLVTSNEGDVQPGEQEAVDLLLSRRVDGIIGVPAQSDLPALSAATAGGTPVVMVDWWTPDLDADSVSLDNVGAGAIAARHLLDHGHREIAILTGEDTVSTMQERLDGFIDIAARNGRPLTGDRIVRAPLTVEEGVRGMNALLNASGRPTAVFTANYELTVGALIAINESGLRLGTDISMLGFDSLELAQTARPKLSVIVQPVREIAIEAARILSMRLSDADDETVPRVTTRLPGQLHVGASVSALHS